MHRANVCRTNRWSWRRTRSMRSTSLSGSSSCARTCRRRTSRSTLFPRRRETGSRCSSRPPGRNWKQHERPPMSDRGRRFGILGGTLDPIHCGHLAAAVAARDALDLSQVLVLPSGVPPHRQQPLASAFQRFAMAALAVTGVDRFLASDDELKSEGPSYTADTLGRQHARGIYPQQIFFVTGADAFADIETWRRYPAVLDLANFVVVARPGYAVSALRSKLPALAPRMRPAE